MIMSFYDELNNANNRHGHTFAPRGKQPTPPVYDLNRRARFQRKEKAAVRRSRDISRADLDRIRIAVHIQRWIQGHRVHLLEGNDPTLSPCG